MITEQQQREAYEFIREELRGQDWTLDVNRFFPEKGRLWAQRATNKYGFHPACWVPPLYTHDGQPDYNTFIREFEPALESANVTVELVHGFWLLLEVGTARGWENPDPYAAFSQWREAQ